MPDPLPTDPRTAAFALGAPAAQRCLLLHGLTGSPSELRLIGEALVARGFQVDAPLHPGHGFGAADLLSAGHPDWEAAARAALDRFAADGPVHIVGFSMGALLGIRLALAAPEKVRSLALLAPAVRLAAPTAQLAWLAWRFPALVRRFPSVTNPAKSSLRDLTHLARDVKNSRVSLRALAGLRALQATILAQAPEVRTPSLVVFAAHDKTIDNRWGEKLAQALRAQVVVVPNSSHQLGLDFDRDLVTAALLRFFEQL